MKSSKRQLLAMMVAFMFVYPFVAAAHDTISVKLERVYIDGEVSEEMIQETNRTMDEILKEYAGWAIVAKTNSSVHLRKEIDDISPLLKMNGYFGLSKDGFFNLYDGRPKEDNVIQSFFQINTKKLKSYERIELQNGIPVLSRENYENVLKTYKRYATSES